MNVASAQKIRKKRREKMKIRVKTLAELGWKFPMDWSPAMGLMFGNIYEARVGPFGKYEVDADKSYTYYLLPDQVEPLPEGTEPEFPYDEAPTDDQLFYEFFRDNITLIDKLIGEGDYVGLVKFAFKSKPIGKK